MLDIKLATTKVNQINGLPLSDWAVTAGCIMPTAPVSGAVAQLGVLTSSYLNSSQESEPERYLAQVHIAYPHQPPRHTVEGR